MAKSKLLPTQTNDLYTIADLEVIRDFPHILGHLCGYPDLTELHSEWIRYAWDSNGKHRTVQAARGTMKTSSITEIGSIRWLLFHPEAKLIILRKSFSEAAACLANITKMMDYPEIKELFRFAHGESWKYNVKRQEAVEFSFKKKPSKDLSIAACGLDGSIIGRHGRVVADDVVTIKDRLSAAERKRTELIMRDVYTSISDRGQGVVLTGTPWHPEDYFSIAPKGIVCDVYQSKLFTEEQIAIKRSTETSVGWAAQYLLTHVPPEDAPFGDIKYSKWQFSETERVVAHIDPAYGKGDSCALTIAAKRMDGIIQVVGFSTKQSIADWIPFVVEKCKFYKVKRIIIEDNVDSGWSANTLKKHSIPVIPYTESTNKVHKISTFLTEAWPKIYFDEECTGEAYLSMISQWEPTAKNLDDSPDSLASLCRAYYSNKDAKTARWEF